MAKKAWKPEYAPDSPVTTEEGGSSNLLLPKEGMTEGFSLSGLFSVDLTRQTCRIATAAGVAVKNQPDNRVDLDMTGGTLTIPPGWRVINF